MLACPECTAWHLPIERAHRDEAVRMRATARTADRATPLPLASDVAPAALHLAA
jgi:hypothetical protein